MTVGAPYTVLFRASTDNDTNLMFINTIEPYYQQTEQILETKMSDGMLTVKSRIRNKLQEYLCMDTS